MPVEYRVHTGGRAAPSPDVLKEQLTDREEAPAAAAALRSLFGPSLVFPSFPNWVGDVVSAQHSKRQRVDANLGDPR